MGNTDIDTLFIASGPLSWASARMRAYWVSEHMSNALTINSREVNPGERIPSARNYVWQKIAQPELMKAQLAQGAQVWWDCCDPMWWWSPDECREIMHAVTGVVCSNMALAHDLHTWMYPQDVPVYVIRDRIDFAHFQKRHQHLATNPVRLIWFGLSVNRMALYGALANLERLIANRHPIALTICDDRPNSELNIDTTFPVYYTRWSLEQENEIIATHDIALLPPYPGPWGKVKSDNKRITALACGLPVSDGQDYEELCRLVDYSSVRQEEAEIGYKNIRIGRDVSESAQEWQSLFNGDHFKREQDFSVSAKPLAEALS